MSHRAAFIDRLHLLLSRSATITRFAILLRNQCRAIIKHRLMNAADVATSGEAWLAERMASRCRTFVDAGANTGQWAGIFLEYAPVNVRGFLYEPGREAMEILRRNVRRSGIETIDAALSDRPTEGATFFEERSAGSMSSLTRAAAPENSAQTLVRVTTLDIEMQRLGIEAIDFLKIDTEGHDLYVLRGAESLLRRQAIAALQFEYSDAWARSGGTLGAALDLLSAHGYRSFVLARNCLYRFDYGMFGEFFTYSNFVAFTPAALEPFAADVRDLL
ncbi:MAG TPA: FkbM family methyltransferase [Thermoanaerobaculia bacterium]|jgi:FkbM family methyltransferase|nr:FkbM family methyltransferase [Thermoanaerobaculia bacterium]